MGTETLISVAGITRFFGRHRAVTNLSFTLGRGEVLGFLGPNGAGKTTTMQIICGVLAATTGRVAIAGHDIAEDPRQAKRHLGYLPERPPLYMDQTVDEYLRFCARLRGISGRRQVAAMAQGKQRCGLEAVGTRLIGNLSKGYQQRVGIAQAILHNPPVILLDEPTVGLDPIQIMEIRALIRELGRDHGILLSTHILPEVETTCTHAAIIHAGELVLQGSLPELTRESENLEQVYLRIIRRADAGPRQDAAA